MKNRIVKAAIIAPLTPSFAGGLFGCVGSNAVSGKLLKFSAMYCTALLAGL